MRRRTKIICTIGPAVASLEKMCELIRAGMNVARVNFSHRTHEEHRKTIALLKEARKKEKVPLAIMLDTKGPEIRLGVLEDDVFLRAGNTWTLVSEEIVGNAEQVSINPGFVIDRLEKGTRVLLDDGYIETEVIKKTSKSVTVRILNDGIMKSRKGVNVPEVDTGLPALSEQDIEDIKLGCELDIDLIAASFVRSADHVIAVKDVLREEGHAEIKVIAKIENHEGVENLESILQIADGVMVARGDLGIEVPLTEVPKLQKIMIRKSCIAGKPVVTATHMLESMISNPRPTRAEASDVANAIYDSTSAIMLSGETAIGKYPVETVEIMDGIAKETESDFHFEHFLEKLSGVKYHDVPSALTLAAVQTAYSMDATAIFAFTASGSTARMLARLRPRMPVIAMTSSLKTYHQLSSMWGVIPIYAKEATDYETALQTISDIALKQELVSYGDLVVITAGQPFGYCGTTNLMVVESIGDVLVRAHEGYGEAVNGNVLVVPNLDNVKPFQVRGKVIVTTNCSDNHRRILKSTAGIVLENTHEDTASEDFLRSLGKSSIIRADGALGTLSNGQLVTIDPKKALVLSGVRNERL